jgi:hypothetical protein
MFEEKEEFLASYLLILTDFLDPDFLRRSSEKKI